MPFLRTTCFLVAVGIFGSISCTNQETVPDRTATVKDTAPDPTAPTKDPEQIGFTLMKAESLGQLKLELAESTVSSILTAKPKKGKLELWGGDGLYHQEWKYPELGIRLGFFAEKEEGQRTLWSITATTPCTFKTQRGIHIGSTEAEALAAYHTEFNKEDSMPGESIVAGSIYGGLSFLIKDHRVSQIFIGSAAD